MSVSMRSTKAQMYSEIERLRALLDQRVGRLRALLGQRDNQIASLEEKVLRREAKIEELSASISAPQPSAAPRAPELSDRGIHNLMMKRLAITCKASVKWVDGQGFRQYKDGSWVGIPTHTVEFVAKGIGQ